MNFQDETRMTINGVTVGKGTMRKLSRIDRVPCTACGSRQRGGGDQCSNPPREIEWRWRPTDPPRTAPPLALEHGPYRQQHPVARMEEVEEPNGSWANCISRGEWSNEGKINYSPGDKCLLNQLCGKPKVRDRGDEESGKEKLSGRIGLRDVEEEECGRE